MGVVKNGSAHPAYVKQPVWHAQQHSKAEGMPEFMLLFRGGEAERKSPQEMQALVQRYIVWVRQLRAEGKFKAGDELRPDGRVISKSSTRLTDAPFAESKDAVGGYFLIEAVDYEEAVQIAKSNPNLDNGGWVEVRQISDYQ